MFTHVVFLLVFSAAHTLSAEFDEWASLNNKNYASLTDSPLYKHRRAVFQDNLLKIQDLQKLNPHATFTIRVPSADLTDDEFRERFTGYVGSSSSVDTKPQIADAAQVDFSKLTTKKIDWREHGAVDPTVFDQGECGCCWAISVTQTVGSQYFLKKNLSSVPSLSFQQLICCDCNSEDSGCHGGDPHLAYEYIALAGGVESSEEYPFTDSGPDAQSCNLEGKCNKCKFDKQKVVATITGYQNVTQADPVSGNPGNETRLAEALAAEGPISVCIDSDPWRFYSGGILSYGARKLNHCVQLVGMDAGYSTPYWTLKNSWGATWGEKGYIRMQMGMDICGVADVATVPTVGM